MADEKYPSRLYDANGLHVADVEFDEDMSAAANRERVIEAGGKTYLWNQRNGQWREAGETVKVSGSKVEKVEAPAAEGESGGGKAAAGKS